MSQIQTNPETDLLSLQFGTFNSENETYVPFSLSGNDGSEGIYYISLQTYGAHYDTGTKVGTAFESISLSWENYISSIKVYVKSEGNSTLQGFTLTTSQGNVLTAGNTTDGVIHTSIENTRILKLAFSQSEVSGYESVTGMAIDYVQNYSAPVVTPEDASVIGGFWLAGGSFTYYLSELAKRAYAFSLMNNHYINNRINASMLVDWTHHVHKILLLQPPTEFSIDSVTSAIQSVLNEHQSYQRTVESNFILVRQSQNMEIIKSGDLYWFRNGDMGENNYNYENLPGYYSQFFDMTGQLNEHCPTLEQHKEVKYGWTYYSKFS
tara:strand:- start:605 stop:1570 length:966 start_codon:yes stop_codon:yes gene_type:complete